MVDKSAKDEIRNIVRIADRDINGYVTIERALTKIKGVNKRTARIMSKLFCAKAKLKEDIKLGAIAVDKDELLSDIVRDPLKYGVPAYLINRQKDLYDGEDKHLINNDLDFIFREDRQRLSKVKSRRGLRLNVGLPVRGQKTKSRRKGGGVVGVSKKR